MSVVGGIKLTWSQTKFNSALKDYLMVTSRTVERAVNTKAFYIARAATRFTLKVGKDKIAYELGTLKLRVQKSTKGGKLSFRALKDLRSARSSEAPLAALIINKRLGDGKTFRGHSGKGLYGRDMRDAIKYLVGIRKRSVGFIASGWLGAIKRLAPYADKIGGADSGTDATIKRLGAYKGGATPAKEGKVMVATIINNALAKHDKHNSLARHGGQGLQLAFDHETKSILTYLANKMKPDTDKANRRLK